MASFPSACWAELLPAVGLGLAIASGGCAPTLPSPSASLAHLSSPDALAEGTKSAALGLSYGGELFGPTTVAATGRARRGLGEALDVGLEASALVALGDQLEHPPHRGVYAGRAFVHRTVVRRWLALQAGLGGGGSAAGGYLAGDAGLTLGFENPYLVPYGFGHGLASIPLTHPLLDLTLRDDTARTLREAYPSVGARYGVGVRVPLGARVLGQGSVYLEWNHLLLAGKDPAESTGFEVQRGLSSATLAYEVRFGQPTVPAASANPHEAGPGPESPASPAH